MLPVNQVFQFGDLRKRLLWSGTDFAVWIDIDSQTALPDTIQVAELERLLMDGDLEGIADPFEAVVLREVENGSLDQKKRDELWKILEDIAQEPGLFVSRSRGQIESPRVF